MPTTTCYALTTKGTPCTRMGDEANVYVYNNVVRYTIPSSYDLGTWAAAYVPLCTQHTTMLINKKSLTIKENIDMSDTTILLYAAVKEGEMPTHHDDCLCQDCYDKGLCPTEFGTFDEEGNYAPLQDTVGMPFHPTHGDIGAVNPEYEQLVLLQQEDDIDQPCDEFHPFVHNQLMYIHSECTVCGFNLPLHPDKDKYREPTQEEILAAEKNKGVLCGKCRKNGVPHPYHENVMQVRICYKKVTFK